MSDITAKILAIPGAGCFIVWAFFGLMIAGKQRVISLHVESSHIKFDNFHQQEEEGEFIWPVPS